MHAAVLVVAFAIPVALVAFWLHGISRIERHLQRKR